MRLKCHAVNLNFGLMAERIDSLPPLARQIYPWAEWLDGSTWRIRRGQDFEVSADSMATQVRLRAQREGGTAACRIVEGGEVVAFQFFGPDEEKAA